jgi:hypothetical protein
MNSTRKMLISGLVGLGLVGTLAAGVGVASEATAATPGPAATPGATLSYRGGPFGGMSEMMSGRTMPITAVATYLGLSVTDLQTQVRAGRSLADLARAHGRSVAGLQEAMLAAMTSSITADTTLSGDQKSALLALMRDRVAAMVTSAGRSGVGCPLLGQNAAGSGTTGAGTGMGAMGGMAAWMGAARA